MTTTESDDSPLFPRKKKSEFTSVTKKRGWNYSSLLRYAPDQSLLLDPEFIARVYSNGGSGVVFEDQPDHALRLGDGRRRNGSL